MAPFLEASVQFLIVYFLIKEKSSQVFLFNQNAIIHLKSSNTNRILARDPDDYYCTKSEAHHQMKLQVLKSTRYCPKASFKGLKSH